MIDKKLNNNSMVERFYKWLKEIVEPLTPSNEECFIGGYKTAYEDMWQTISDNNPLPKFKEVLAYNKEWVEADWNPSGIRLGYFGEMGFVSAAYDPDGEGYGTRFEEGDDYDTSQIDENGIEHTFYNNGNEKGNVEGFRPNMPTHFMEIPNPEFRFGVYIGLLNQR